MLNPEGQRQIDTKFRDLGEENNVPSRWVNAVANGRVIKSVQQEHRSPAMDVIAPFFVVVILS